MPSHPLLAILAAGPAFIGIFTHAHVAKYHALPLIDRSLPRDKLGEDVRSLTVGTWYLLSAFYGLCGACKLRWCLYGTVDGFDEAVRWTIIAIDILSALAFVSVRGLGEWRIYAMFLSALSTALAQ